MISKYRYDTAAAVIPVFQPRADQNTADSVMQTAYTFQAYTAYKYQLKTKTDKSGTKLSAGNRKRRKIAYSAATSGAVITEYLNFRYAKP